MISDSSSFCNVNVHAAVFGSKAENKFSALDETPNNLSARSVNERFLLPGLSKYARSSISASNPFIFSFFKANLPPWTYLGRFGFVIQLPISALLTLKTSLSLVAIA